MAANMEVDGLTPQQERAIPALLTYPTIKAAAEACGIGERTLHTWIDEPAFLKAFRKARRQTFQQAISMCQKATPVAVQALHKIVTDPGTKANVRVAAASAIMKYGRWAALVHREVSALAAGCQRTDPIWHFGNTPNQ
jgi:hypothetical protein